MDAVPSEPAELGSVFVPAEHPQSQTQLLLFKMKQTHETDGNKEVLKILGSVTQVRIRKRCAMVYNLTGLMQRHWTAFSPFLIRKLCECVRERKKETDFVLCQHTVSIGSILCIKTISQV